MGVEQQEGQLLCPLLLLPPSPLQLLLLALWLLEEMPCSRQESCPSPLPLRQTWSMLVLGWYSL